MDQSASVDNSDNSCDILPDGPPVDVEAESFVAIPEWVLLHPDLSGEAVRLYGLLRSFARRAPTSYPKRETLATRLGCSVDTVDRLAKQLVGAGALQITRRWKVEGADGLTFFSKPGPGRTQASNLYSLRWTQRARVATKPDPTPPDGGTPSTADPRPSESRSDEAPGAAGVRHKAHALETPSRPLRGRGARTKDSDDPLPGAASAETSSTEGAKVVDIQRGTRLPEGWRPSDKTRQWTFAQGLTEREAGRILANFRDYWMSKPGKEGRKLDWELTWQRWIRTEVDEGRLARTRRTYAAVAGAAVPRTPIDA